jgi:hypothetical protein
VTSVVEIGSSAAPAVAIASGTLAVTRRTMTRRRPPLLRIPIHRPMSDFG